MRPTTSQPATISHSTGFKAAGLIGITINAIMMEPARQAAPIPSLPPGTLYGLGRSGSVVLIRRQAKLTMVQEKINASADTLVSGTSIFLPRNGPTMVKQARSMLAIFGAPLFGSISANFSGS